MEIFLEGYRSKKSVNESEGLNVKLEGRRKLLPLNDVGDVVSQNDQYMEERKACNKIRLTCQVNPICSNVLFNRVSEIVKDEGSSAVTFLNYKVLNGETTDGDLDGDIMYKPKEMSFWGGSASKYQGVDSTISNKSRDNTTITEAIGSSTSPYYDGSFFTSDDSKHPTNAIRDMQLSNHDFVYHCGLDILNNHLIRSNTFKVINKGKNEGDYTSKSNYTAFNTIADLMRDTNGDKVVEKITFPLDANVDENSKFVTMHVYEYDDILPFEDAIAKRLISKFNGWVGFDNKSKIKSYDDFSKGVLSPLPIERPIMYMNGGDFVDMYPDRSLYSFVPKYNHFRQRVEKNWNYCITYPSSSYTPTSSTEPFGDIFEITDNINSLKTIYFDETTRADNGTTQLVMYSISKHGLSVGDTVNIYRTYNDGEKDVSVKIIDNGEVSEVVDDYIFTLFNSSVQISTMWVELTDEELMKKKFTAKGLEYTISDNRKTCKGNGNTYYIVNGRNVNIDDNAQRISYKKVVNDIECEYYIRIFSKLPNFKYASGDTSNQYQIYKDAARIIDIYQDKEYDFENHISRLAFAKNIYTDEVGEVVFTDDLNIANLKDNLGRPLSSLYITFVKNNKGYKQWYGYDLPSWTVTDINDEEVEYSHCFGAVTCALEISYESSCGNAQGIRLIAQNRVSDGGVILGGYNVSRINEDRPTNVTEREIWFDTDKHYYGDLAYYDNYNAVERSIQNVMHRFNTAQRESKDSSSNQYFNKFIVDEIQNDDYDVKPEYTVGGYEIDEANNKKEGYFYNPHYEIPIRTFDKLETLMPDFLTIRSIVEAREPDSLKITVLQRHFLTVGDKAVLYDSEKERYFYLSVINGVDSNERVFTCDLYFEGRDVPLAGIYALGGQNMYSGDEKLSNYKLFKIDNLDAPSYARILKDGTCRIIWRNIVNNGLNKSDKTIEEYPFTNGAFYVNKRIDIYVRRQDPYGLYGSYSDDDIEGVDVEIENEDNYVKDTEIVC